MSRAFIRATGSFLPARLVHNEALDRYPDQARMLISHKTGVFCRRHAEGDQCTSDLALEAAKRCLENAGLTAEALDGIMLSTSSPDRMQPATATRLQYLLGAVNAFAFDINSVCSGSTYGIALASAMIRSGICRQLLFVAAEAYSKILNPGDFATYPYFGDGAGAILFSANETCESVLCSVLGTDGSGHGVISVPGGGTMLPYDRIEDRKAVYFHMKGREVFTFAVTKGSAAIAQLLEKSGHRPDQIKCFICHQANANILIRIAEHLNVSEERFYMNLFRYGNTASASVLIALDEALRDGIVKSGDLVVTAAFGGGLSWGANLIRL